jgi:1,4-alpha-glucan branching enzyme
MTKKIPKLLQDDMWLQPYSEAIINRIETAEKKEKELAGDKSLYEFASGHLYFGLHKTAGGWVMREWAPHATYIFLIGTFNNWEEHINYAFEPLNHGVWVLDLKEDDLHHGDLYALSMHWAVDYGKRVPAWANYVVQDPETHIFNAQVWRPEQLYQWKNNYFKGITEPPLIYEAHIGMSGEEERVHTYNEFRENMLPRIKANGYNTVQLMAIPEHPYYGSFGYHVSSFFAPSSRFGTPDELKHLIDEAHNMELAVIMDIVHSHAVKNEVEGLGKYDGTRYLFFMKEEKASIRPGIPTVLITEKTKCFIFCSPTSSSGLKNSGSTVLGLMALPACYTSIMAWEKPLPVTTITSAGMLIRRRPLISGWQTN